MAGDVSHLQGQSGYHYKVPQTSYGVPTHQVNAQSYTAGHSYKGYQQALPAQQASVYSQQGFREPGYQQGGYQNSGYQSGSQYQTGSNAGYHNQNNAGQHQSSGLNVAQAPSSGYQYSGAQHGNQYHTANQYQSGSQYQTTGQQYQATGQQHQAAAVVQKYQEYFRQQQQQPAQVFKHFYVHAAPEEPEQPKFRQPPVLPAPQKHYKIIFIKTPTQPALEPQFVPIQQQNEEKTIVYVLVQKPEEARDIVVPKAEQKPPAKPEVFFIKYKGKEGSQAVINNIVNDYSKGEAGSVQQYNGAENTGASAVSDASGAFAQSSVGQAESQYGSINQHVEEHSNDVHQSEYQVPQYFGSEVQGIKTASAEAVSGSYQKAESSTVAESGVSSSEAQTQESFNTISTSQGVPHESYGPPKFRAN